MMMIEVVSKIILFEILVDSMILICKLCFIIFQLGFKQAGIGMYILVLFG